MQSVLRGLRTGVVLFRTSPGAALAAVAALALGIGASTTMFSIVHGGTRTLPIDDASRIVAVQRLAMRPGPTPASTVADYERWSAQSRSFEALGAFQADSRNLSGEGESPERVSVATVTTGTIDLLRTRPLIGRGFIASDHAAGAVTVALMSHALWTRRYHADAGVIGRTIRLDGEAHTVIGVMPARFGFPINAAIWTVLPTGTVAAGAATAQVFGRLAPEADADTARSELLTIAQAAAGTGEARAAIGLDVIPFAELETPREARLGLYLLLFASSGVLVIACVNVACLFIARAVARSRDVAVRLALGAERRQILIEQVAESFVLSSLATVAGLGMAWAGTRTFRLASADVLEAFWMDFRVDVTVMLYASALAIAAAAAAAILPALRASRTDVIATLRDGGIASTSLRIGRLTRGVLAAQIALACGLLALTVLLGQSAVSLHTRAWPFDPAAVLTAQISVPLAQMDDDVTRGRLLNRLDEELRSLPGARAAALASALPGRGSGGWGFTLDAPPVDGTRQQATALTMVSPSYFDVLGAQAVRGRALSPQDRLGALAVVVNESFVARFSADREPIGRRVFIGRREATIVGIVPDLMPNDIETRDQHGVYVSIHQMRPYGVRVLATGAAGPMALVRPLREAVDRVDRDLPIIETFTVRDAALRDKQILGVISSMFGVFGAGALLLIAIGLFSVTAFAVAQRRREIGIRIALGATRGDVVRLLSADSGRQVIVGLVAGTGLAMALTRGFASAVELPTAPGGYVIGVVVLALSMSSILAMVGPVVRASRLTAAETLRDGN